MKKKTIEYKGFGFPIILVDVPIKNVDGEEVLNINLLHLQELVFRNLIFKPNPLTGKQLRFIRKFLEMSTTVFAKKFGVTHPTVLKWESDQSDISPTTEFCIRLFALKHVQNGDLNRLCYEVTIEKLIAGSESNDPPLKIDDPRLIAC